MARRLMIPPSERDELAAGEVLALEVCHLFFDEQCSKKEIGDRLAISRFRVARLIEQALESGLVRIQYRERELIDRDLSRRLADAYRLRLCIVVSSGGRSEADMRRAVGGAAASLVSELIAPGEVIGLGWGRSVAAMVDCMPETMRADVDVVQLAGGSAGTAFGMDPSELARRFASKVSGRLHVIHAPAFVKSREVRDALLQELDVAGTVALFDRITLAVLGVGALSKRPEELPASTLSIAGVLPRESLAQVVGAGAVGELMLHPFDADGAFIANPADDRCVAISVDQLRLTRVLAVASGSAKGDALAGALKTGVPSILVTDAAAARWLIDHAPAKAGRG
jgi:DNA-binding transcriptional regulator LsrR (DeoR family)